LFLAYLRTKSYLLIQLKLFFIEQKKYFLLPKKEGVIWREKNDSFLLTFKKQLL